MESFEDKIIMLIKQDPARMLALACVYQLDLPQCYIAAGFVRNLVWDSLHARKIPTHLNDIDVIYFDANEANDDDYLNYEAKLKRQLPMFNWQVRNQAVMHKRNGDKPYQSTIDAMHFWPEKETAVGIRKQAENHYECISAFGFDSLFGYNITHNPKRSREIFEARIYSKNWLTLWPFLKVVY